ncbi:MAG TPA: hypothetical protein VG826_27440 [Pirellulales bacterium]|nr:hypothetical protein [Pirellulales bacterium]
MSNRPADKRADEYDFESLRNSLVCVLRYAMAPALKELQAIDPAKITRELLIERAVRLVREYYEPNILAARSRAAEGLPGESEAKWIGHRELAIRALGTPAGDAAFDEWWREHNYFPYELDLLRQHLAEAMVPEWARMPPTVTLDALLPVAIERWERWRDKSYIAARRELHERLPEASRRTSLLVKRAEHDVRLELAALKTYEGRQILLSVLEEHNGSANAEPPDGPQSRRSFRFKGSTATMPPAASAILDYLWKAPNMTADTEELAHQIGVKPTGLRKHQADINNAFTRATDDAGNPKPIDGCVEKDGIVIRLVLSH